MIVFIFNSQYLIVEEYFIVSLQVFSRAVETVFRPFGKQYKLFPAKRKDSEAYDP
jgi:hypothetical protein